MKKQSKAAKVRAMLAQGKTAEQIVSAVGVTKQYVYALRHMERKRIGAAATYDPNPMPVPPATEPPKRGPGRPKGSKNKVAAMATSSHPVATTGGSLPTPTPTPTPAPSKPVVVSIEPYERQRTFVQRLVYLFTNK